MKALFVTPPGYGHLHPLAGLAQAVKDAGHEAYFSSSASFTSRIEKAGFESLPAGPDWLEAEPEKGLSWLGDAPRAGDHPFRFLTDVFLEVAHQIVPELRQACVDHDIDVLVRTDYDFASPIVAEQLDLPHVTVGTDFLMPVQVWRAVAGPSLAFLRRRCGLSHRSDYYLIYRDLLLSVLPEVYDYPDGAPVHVERLHIDYTGAPEGSVVPRWLEELEDRPTVYFSLGTVFNRSREVFLDVLRGLEELDVNVITTVGHNQDPTSFGDFRPGIHIEHYVPQSFVLPRADLAMTHGGGSLLGALAHGVPVVAMPMAGNQPFHAVRCLELGVGGVLRPRGRFGEFFTEPPPEVSPENTRDTVAALLADAGVRERAARLKTAFDEMPGPAAAVIQIERIMAERTPARSS